MLELLQEFREIYKREEISKFQVPAKNLRKCPGRSDGALEDGSEFSTLLYFYAKTVTAASNSLSVSSFISKTNVTEWHIASSCNFQLVLSWIFVGNWPWLQLEQSVCYTSNQSGTFASSSEVANSCPRMQEKLLCP